MSEYVRAFIRACEGYGWQGGPRFSTRIVTKANGRERRNADWDQPQHQFGFPLNNIGQTQYVPVKEMHLNRRGAWGCFLFRDRLDYIADDEILATAEAGQTEFQLGKWSVIDGVAYFRKVFALFAPNADGTAQEADPEVTVNGSPAGAHTVDHDRGAIIFDTPMTGGEVLRWSGVFAVWVRFQSDDLPFSIDNLSGGEYIVNGMVNLVEMPPPPLLDSGGD